MPMPRLLTVLAVLGLSLPGLAQASGFGRKKGSGSSSSSSSSSNKSSNSSGGDSHNAAPVGAPHQAQNGSPGYSPGYSSGSSGRYYSRPAYSGYYGGPRYYSYYGWGVHPWGYYGYGYYPYYGGPVIAEQVPVQPPMITSSIFLGGMVTNAGAGLDLRAQVDGERLGINFDAVGLPSVNPDDPTTRTVMPLLNGHITYSVIADLHARLRLEGGVTSVFAPDVTYIGPDVGVSGQVALVGPLAVEAAAHWTPLPASIIDADAGLALHFGNLGLRAGWRLFVLDDRRVNEEGGVDVLTGPSLSVGLVF